MSAVPAPDAATSTALPEGVERLVLYDGLCGMCDQYVQFLLDTDPEGRVHFAPLQGPTAASVVARHPEIPEGLDSILFVERLADGTERVTWRSTAFFRICAVVGGPWRWLGPLAWIPTPLSDVVYRFVASIRLWIWGRLEACRIPTEAEAARFLD